MTGPGAAPNDLIAALDAQTGTAGFATILDNLAEAVTIREPDGQLVYANRAALESMGFDTLEAFRATPAGAIFNDYVVQDEHGGLVTMADIPSVRLLAGEGAEPLLLGVTNRSTGVRKWLLLKSAPIRERDGRLVAAVTIIEDITSQRRAEARDRFLSEATATLMSSLDYEKTLRLVAELAVPEMADWCAVDLVEGPGMRQRVAVVHRDPAKLALAAELERLRPPVMDADRGIGRVVQTGRSEHYPEISDEMIEQSDLDPAYRALLRQVGMRSVLIAPLRSRGRSLGAMTLVTAESLRRFDDADRVFVEELAARAAVAMDNARLATERRQISMTLQRSLMPESLPDVPDWSIAAMYRPGGAAEEVEVGGDFYDLFATDAGWIVLLGDVTGKDLEAATMTAMVRHGARFVARAIPNPAAILAELDVALRERDVLSLCTAVCLRLDPGEAVIGVAGHPAPLVLRDDGRLRTVGATGPILGAWPGGEWPTRRTAVGPDETLIVYTDGITDLPGADGRFGIERLRRFLVRSAGCSPDELVGNLERELGAFQAAGPRDDTAMLALRPTGVTNSRAVGNGQSLAAPDRDRGG